MLDLLRVGGEPGLASALVELLAQTILFRLSRAAVADGVDAGLKFGVERHVPKNRAAESARIVREFERLCYEADPMSNTTALIIVAGIILNTALLVWIINGINRLGRRG